MGEIKIWHNPRCRKSREGLKYLHDHGVEPVIINYTSGEFETAALVRAIKNSGLPLKEFIRRQEKDFKALNVNADNLTPESFAELVRTVPKILQRPIVEKGDQSVLGRPVENIKILLD